MVCFLFVLLYMWRIRVRQKVNLRVEDIILKLKKILFFWGVSQLLVQEQ